MGQHLAAYTVFVPPECLADGFGLLEEFQIGHLVPWYHACAFF